MEGMTACVSTFFVNPRRRQLSPPSVPLPLPENCNNHGDNDGDDDIGVGTSAIIGGGGDSGDGGSSVGGGRSNLFAAAALDLLMVLHARLPSAGNGAGRPRRGAGTVATEVSSAVEGLTATASAAFAPPAAAAPASTGKFNSAVAAPPFSPADALAVSAGGGGGGGGGEGGRGGGGSGGGGGASAGSGRERIAKAVSGGSDAWVIILRALSLGSRSGERGVAMHALQLLTKVCFRRGGLGRLGLAWPVLAWLLARHGSWLAGPRTFLRLMAPGGRLFLITTTYEGGYTVGCWARCRLPFVLF